METGEARVRRIFHEASEMAPSDRAAFLERECAGDKALRALVESLLKSLGEAGDFLAPKDEPAGPGNARMEAPGARVGPYRLLQQIGEGGFGVVFLAEQQTPVVRRVALKVIKLGMDTRQVIARFDAERQALALMDHPNIARVLDAGATDAGRPYFVMELVRGEPITAYCDHNALSTKDRLALFVDICGAIQHAHQKGIIHRDIKPANILVSTADGRAIPKVIDFGIAKATIARLTEKTLFTEHRQLIGTPQYMSPEQADMTSIDVDTRSDVYSLGVLLYELLTGTTPFDVRELRSAAFAEMQRIIREVEPPKPSTRLGTLGNELGVIALRRHSDPAKLTRLVRGDLDWIVMKALEKERGRRYETANGLARDVERHLLDEPVSAGPPSRSYKFRKFVRRNRGMVVAGSIVAATLVLGIIGTSAGMAWALDEQKRAGAARDAESEQRRAAQASEVRAQAEATRAKTVLAVLDDMLKPPPARTPGGPNDEAESGPAPFVEHLGGFARAWGLSQDDDPAVEAEVRLLLGRTLRVEGLHTAACQQFERVVEIRRELSSELDPQLGEALRAQAEALSAGGDHPGALKLARAALERARATGPDDPELAARLSLHADACCWAGEFAKAEASSLEALALRERSPARSPVEVAENLSQLAGILARGPRQEEAIALYQDAAQRFREARGELDAGTWSQEQRLSRLHEQLGQRSQAAAVARDAVERARHAMSASPPAAERRAMLERLRLLSSCLQFVPESIAEATDVGAEMLEFVRAMPDEDPLVIALDLSIVARGFWCQGRSEEAEKLLREAIALARAFDTPAGRWRVTTNQSSLALAILYGPRGRTKAGLAEAEAELRETYAATRQYNPSGGWTVWLVGHELAWVRRLQGDESEAQALEREAATMDHANMVSSLPMAWRLQKLGEGLIELQQYATAEPILAAREMILKKRCPEHWLRWDAGNALSGCRGNEGKFAAAEPLLRESVPHLLADPSTPPADLRRALSRTADFYAAWHAAEPATSREAEAAEWRRRLLEHDAAHVLPDAKPR